MKALLLHEMNKWMDMKVEEIGVPELREGEVLIEGYSASLNPVDFKTGTNGNPNWIYPHVLGLDVAGIVAKVGPGVTEIKEGDRVVYHGNWNEYGAYAEYTRAKAHMVIPIPDDVSFDDAAALPTAGFTAYQAIYQKIPTNTIKSILIHAGAGGVGGFAIQLAKNLGKVVYSTASSLNHEAVRVLGADHVIDYREEDWVKRVMELTEGHGVDAVIDTVGRDNATTSLDVIAYNGHIAYIAGAPDQTKVKPFTRVISFHEVALNAIHHQNDRKSEEGIVEIGKHMLEMVRCHEIDPMITERITLAEVPQNLVKLSERHVRGKIIVDLRK